MAYNTKKYLDEEGLKQVVRLLDEYPDNQILGTVIDEIQSELDKKADIVSIPEVPVQDVQIAGTSVLNDGIANVPIAAYQKPGVVKVNSDNGLTMSSNGTIMTYGAGDATIKQGTNWYQPIVPQRQHQTVFYGLAKASGDVTQSESSNSVGTYTPEAKGAIQKMLGVSDLIATEENNLIASKAYAVGDVFTANGKLYKATAAIATDGAIITDGANANCEETNVGEGFVKFTDYATASTPGIVKIGAGLAINNGSIQTGNAGDAAVKEGTHANLVIAPARQHMSVFYGLSKVAGVDLANATVTLGTYPDNAKIAIRTMLGTVGDVQINGTSVVSNGVAEIPLADHTTFGVAKVSSNLGVNINPEGYLTIGGASSSTIKSGNSSLYPITVVKQHESTFYGLAKAAGDITQSVSSNVVGDYTPEAKAAIWEMLGLDGSAFVKNDWELIREDTFTNETEAAYTINVDKDGNSFELTDLILMFETPKQDTYAAKGTYGQVYLYYGDNSYYNPEPGAWTQSANAAAHAAFYIAEQRDGLIFISHTVNTTATNSGAIRYRYGEGFKSAGNGIQVVPKRSFNKIIIPTVTGTGHYILYGKREHYSMDSAIVNISSTTPTITGLPGHRYVCGEVTSLDVTLPTSGCVDILFESGSTPAILTVPNTVKWPEWFDPDNLETNCTYEINIMDSKYGVVSIWPLS